MISLRPRTEAHVKLYFERTQNEIIRKMLPSAAKTMEDALRMFREASEGKTASYGRTIYMDGIYPLIFFSFASIKGDSYSAVKDGIYQSLIELYSRYEFLLKEERQVFLPMC